MACVLHSRPREIDGVAWLGLAFRFFRLVWRSDSADKGPNILELLGEESASHPTLPSLVKGKCPKFSNV